ncbi:hypothetical protein ACG873_22045 [Mesorhizobium sp. AaZ16]|uniref:hypothetical protein n=1 Tax=Mesorhizobium sp. AaZ16 TaxID=3402289 RepID=UPI00374F7889
MPITRRQFLAVAALTVSVREPRAYAADQEQAVFWRAAMPGRNANVLFGYARIDASLVPDIVSDGKRLIDETQRIIAAFPNVEMTAWDLPRRTLPPIWKSISRPVADELRAALAGLPDGVPIEELSGIEVSWLLMGEGQTPPNPYLGDVLARHSRSRGRPVAFLITEKEIREQFWLPRDPIVLNDTIDEPKIAFLLDVRRRVGPIGAHLEQLYRARRGEEIYRFTAEIANQGIPDPSTFIEEEKAGALAFDRLLGLLDSTDAPTAFVVLPIGILTGETGILPRLRARGCTVTPIV